MIKRNCISPDLVTEDDLQAYAQGEILPEIAAHVADCLVCQEKVITYRQLYSNVQSFLWRQDCPPVEILQDFQAGYLAEKKNSIEAHIAVCPHCQAELSEFTPLKDEEDDKSVRVLVEQLLSNVRLVIGQLVQPVDGLRPALRGETREVLLFEAGETAVSLNVEPTENNCFTLHGQLLTTQAFTGKARLTTPYQPALESTLSPTGTFSLSSIPSGHYQLTITLPEQQIVLPALSIEV